jgi:DNA-binding Xre family transcriptional regulator
MEEFLGGEGLLEEVELRLQKRSIVDSLQRLMSKRHVGPSELARRMVTSRNQIKRLLDPGDTGVSLRTIDKATKALQATFHLVIEEETKKRSAGGRRR